MVILTHVGYILFRYQFDHGCFLRRSLRQIAPDEKETRASFFLFFFNNYFYSQYKGRTVLNVPMKHLLRNIGYSYNNGVTWEATLASVEFKRRELLHGVVK